MKNMIVYLAPLIAVVGLIIYLAVNNNAKVMRIGEIMFFCGLLATLFLLTGGAFHVR